MSGETAYLTGEDTLEAVDLSDPAHPAAAGLFEKTGLGQAVVAAGDVAYVGSDEGVWVIRKLGPPPAAPPLPHDDRYFPQTGYRVDAAFWPYFTEGGGVQTFGYPISRLALFRGLPTQFFQRRALQRFPDGSVHLLNLLDPGLLSYSDFNFSAFPAPDPALTAQAPLVGSPGYADAALAFVRQHAPEAWNGLPVRFGATFAATVPEQAAFPAGGGNAGLLAAMDLEIWGLPTSAPAFDPHNHRVVYLRWQRGVMQYDAGCDCTRGVLLGEALKAAMTLQFLPPDLAGEARYAPFFAQYCPGAPGWLCRPEDLPGTDLTAAFAPG